MAQFREYNAPDRELRPSEAGFSAFETAGRRIGPAYSQAAQDVREGGRITAQLLELRKWPFDMLALEQRDQSGGGVRLGGGGRGGGGLRGHNQLSAGAGALGRLYGGGGGGGGGVALGANWGGGGTYNTDPYSGLPRSFDPNTDMPMTGGYDLGGKQAAADWANTEAINKTWAAQWAQDNPAAMGTVPNPDVTAIQAGPGGLYAPIVQNLDAQVNGDTGDAMSGYGTASEYGVGGM